MGKNSKKRELPQGRKKGEQAERPASWQAGKTAAPGSAFIYKPVIHILLIGILGLLVYSNTFNSPFQWDEANFIEGNPIVKNLDYFRDPSLAVNMPVYDGLRSRYIGYLSFALNYKLGGLNVTGYHIVNLGIHIINAILVYFLVLLTLKTPYFNDQQPEIGNNPLLSPLTLRGDRGQSLFSLAVALLFVSHPIQTESVTYIFQRLASLVSMFYLLSLVLYIKFRLASYQAEKAAGWQGGRLASYILAIVCAVLAMKTKENAFTLPAVIALYEFLFFTGPLKGRVLRLIPFLFTMAIIPVTMLGAASSAGELIGEVKDPDFLGSQGLSGSDYLFTQFRVIMTYMRLLLFPVNQNLSYSYPMYHSLFDIPVFLSFLFLTALFATAVYLIYKTRAFSNQHAVIGKTPLSAYSLILNPYSRLIAFGILWFFITLSVESSIIPIPMVIDEYRIYLPSVGFFLALTTIGVLAVDRLAKKILPIERIAAVFFIIVIMTLSYATFARNVLWKDKVSLWEDVVSKSPDSPRANNNLGLAYAGKGLHDKAIEHYEKCISLNPSYLFAYTNLGVAYARTGRTGEAIKTFMKALEISPENKSVNINLARAYGDLGRYEKAAEYYGKVVSLAPYDSAAWHGLGTAYTLLGRLDDALAAYSAFVRLSPDDPEAYKSRGVIYANKSDFIRAKADFQKACSLGSKESCKYLRGPEFR